MSGLDLCCSSVAGSVGCLAARPRFCVGCAPTPTHTHSLSLTHTYIHTHTWRTYKHGHMTGTYTRTYDIQAGWGSCLPMEPARKPSTRVVTSLLAGISRLLLLCIRCLLICNRSLLLCNRSLLLCNRSTRVVTSLGRYGGMLARTGTWTHKHT